MTAIELMKEKVKASRDELTRQQLEILYMPQGYEVDSNGKQEDDAEDSELKIREEAEVASDN